jgi:hypothetical protein
MGWVHVFLTLALVVSVTPQPLYPREKSPRYPLDRRLSRPQTTWRGQKTWPYRDSNSDPQSPSQWPVAIPTLLSQLRIIIILSFIIYVTNQHLQRQTRRTPPLGNQATAPDCVSKENKINMSSYGHYHIRSSEFVIGREDALLCPSTDLNTEWSSVLLGKLIVPQLVNKYSSFRVQLRILPDSERFSIELAGQLMTLSISRLHSVDHLMMTDEYGAVGGMILNTMTTSVICKLLFTVKRHDDSHR